jgi:hypothetical protein
MLITNSAEGGSNGTTVTTGNSGGASGTAWNTVTVAANTTAIYSNDTPFVGGLSYQFTSTAAAGSFVIWSGAVTSPSTTMYARCYVRFNAQPVALQRFMQFTNASIQLNAAIGLNVAQNKFVLRNSAGTIVATSATAVPYGNWFRIELSAFSDATIGMVEAKIYLDPQGVVADEVFATASNVNTRGGNINAIVFGNPSVSDALDMNMDEMALSDTGYIGPVTTYSVGWLGT